MNTTSRCSQNSEIGTDAPLLSGSPDQVVGGLEPTNIEYAINATASDNGPECALTLRWRSEALFRLFNNIEIANRDNGGSVNNCWVPKHVVAPGTSQIDPAKNIYYKVTICGRNYQAHDAVLSLVHNRPLVKGEVGQHLCNNPACRNPIHLELGTQKDNMAHAIKCGRVATGSTNGHTTCPDQTPRRDNHYRSRLKGDRRRIALELLKKYDKERGGPKAIAAYLEVSPHIIYNIRRSKDHLSQEVKVSCIELSIKRWGAGANKKLDRSDLENIVRAIRQRFHDTPDHARTGMIIQIAQEFDYSDHYIKQLLKRTAHDDIAKDIPVPDFFGIGTRGYGKKQNCEE